MWTDKINTVVKSDALEFIKTLPNESINCCITSPPYYALRDYGFPEQVGLEKTYQEYINRLIGIFDEVRRVLKKDGTCFVNLGDSYGGESSKSNAGRAGFGNDKVGSFLKTLATDNQRMYGENNFSRLKNKNGSKSLMAIPARFQIAMIDRGWLCRNSIIWIKPNAMPESVQDRWKKAHEYIFFFTKSKKYYFNLNAIRTPHKRVSLDGAEYEQGRNALGINPSSMGTKSEKYGMPARFVKLNPLGACPPDYLIVNTNCSSDDIRDNHYATYPKDLIIPLIKSGSREKDIVYDPFMGSGTTAVVARLLGRNFMGTELNDDYIKICENRLKQQILL